MSDVFSKILQTRPNTFVTFTGTGAVSSGVSPLPYTTTGLTYGTTHLMPGGLSGYATGSGSITFNGRILSNLHEGGKASIELFITSDPNFTGSARILHIPGLFSVGAYPASTGGDGVKTMFTFEELPDAGAFVSHYGTNHVVLGIDGENLTLTVNGNPLDFSIPDDFVFTGAESVIVKPGGGMLWGVVIRPDTTPVEYLKQISELINAHPHASQADEAFNGTSFEFDKSNIDYISKIDLEDADWGDNPEVSSIYNGSPGIASEAGSAELFYGKLPIVDTTGMNSVMTESQGIYLALGGDLRADGSTDEIQLLSAVVNVDSTVNVINKSLIGEPEEFILQSRPTIVPFLGSVFGSVYLLPSSPSIVSTSSPDRRATLETGSAILGWSNCSFFAGGLLKRAFIEPDADATVVAEYPEAYGMWVLVNSAGNLAKSTSFDVSINASLNIITTGVSSKYVDGVVYTTGALSKGWHFVSFIPTTKNNARIELGTVSATNVIKSFSCYYEPAPVSYMLNLYKNYVDPISVKPTTPDTMAITESSYRIYSHDWSISSAD